MIPIQHFLIVAATLFVLGLLNIIKRRNAIGVLLGVELILNAASLNFVAFSHAQGNAVGGNIFALFIIVLAAAEAAVALAIVMAIFQKYRDIDASETKVLHG